MYFTNWAINQKLFFYFSVGFCILVGVGFERIKDYISHLKLTSSTKKQKPNILNNGISNENNNTYGHDGHYASEKNLNKTTNTYSMETLEKEDCNTIEKDINHNDILTSQAKSNVVLSKPTTSVATSSSCSWWMLFIANPRQRPPLQQQQDDDNDLLLNEAISHITFHCSHSNVSSNVNHPSIVKSRHLTAAISVSNYELSTTQPSIVSSSSFATDQRKPEETNSRNVFHSDAIHSEEKCRRGSNKSKHVFEAAWNCFGVSRKIRFMNISKRNFYCNVLCVCTCLVLLFFAMKTFTRNQDWASRKTLFR